MNEIRRRRADIEALIRRLTVEYAGALPPGQIVAAVVRAQRQVVRGGSPWSEERSSLCETLAREQLTRRLAPMAGVR